MQFDISRVPFSRAGSYFAISAMPATAGSGICLRTVHGSAPRTEICRIGVRINGKENAFDIDAGPTLLALKLADATLQVLIAHPESVRFYASTPIEIELKFARGLYDHALQHPTGWQINSFSNRLNYALSAGRGSWELVSDDGANDSMVLRAQADASGHLDVALTEYATRWPQERIIHNRSFADEHESVRAEFKQWCDRLPSVPVACAATRELAAYVLWSAQVAPAGNFRRPALLMSKNWMTRVWSWDHCFNAMALSASHPQLAWDQMLIPFDAQDDSGGLPDCVSDGEIIWNFCKPPIHGWALLWMLRNTAVLGIEQLREIYQPLRGWTEWWFEQRSDFGDGMPHYNHGNDSGWDNCTVFDHGMPMQTADLAALLILQMEALAEIAGRLDATADQARWQQRADEMLAKMLAKFWRDSRFVAVRAYDQKECESDTLMLCLPIILGQRLPLAVRERLVAILSDEQRFLVPSGLASESPRSPHYEPDGYWRGPVWAPAVFMIVDGLSAAGERELAAQISSRFCSAVARSGMAENFDALTGAGLRDPAHAWTASIFLLLASLSHGNPLDEQ